MLSVGTMKLLAERITRGARPRSLYVECLQHHGSSYTLCTRTFQWIISLLPSEFSSLPSVPRPSKACVLPVRTPEHLFSLCLTCNQQVRSFCVVSHSSHLKTTFEQKFNFPRVLYTIFLTIVLNYAVPLHSAARRTYSCGAISAVASHFWAVESNGEGNRTAAGLTIVNPREHTPRVACSRSSETVPITSE